jgi:hypothetical protein
MGCLTVVSGGLTTLQREQRVLDLRPRIPPRP